ncbi:MAG TPA: hypothetical protein VFN79_11025 [Steroidobacteraceae bacterium]|nr:hypothetical protein [Steroidobacteraceae bacterium]
MSAPTIRAVQEFFGAHGRCREVMLADGPRHPVLLSVEQIGAAAAAGDGRGRAIVPELRIRYRGSREDLMALGCVSRESLAGPCSGLDAADARGDSLPVRSRPVPGHRGMIEVSYFARSRACAGMLPGVRTYCADWLENMAAPPPLRLVIDNTRGKPSNPPIPATARLAGA